jgi:NodT family efflux transporter outer membrane factor (OMF) lipoprotein
VLYPSLALMLTNCTLGPDFHTPASPDVGHYLPANGTSRHSSDDRVPGFTLVQGGDVPAQWWALFRSRGLNRLIEDGIEHNAELEAAEAAVRVAQANALAQRGTLFPVVSAGFDANRQKVAARTLASDLASGAGLFSLHTAQVSVSFVPDVFGGIRRQIESTDAQVELELFRREAVFLTLTSNLALAAIQEAALRGQLSATQRLIDIQVQLLGVLKRRQEQGQLPLNDIVAQETAVAQTRLLLPPLERQLAQKRNLMAFLSGRFPSMDSAASFQLTSFRLSRALPLSVPADLVRQRPDVRAAEATLRAVNAQIGVAIANRLPQITLTGNAGSTAESISRLFSPGTAFWMIAGSAVQTVFDAGSLENKQRAAEEATVQAAALYRSAVLAAFQNVADVLRSLQADARAINAAIAAERSASQNIDLVRRQVDEGQVNIPLLLAAQQAYLQALLARVEAEASRLENTVALFQALGGGWWNRPLAVASDSVSVRQ